MRFTVTTLGCKANQYDTGTIVDVLKSSGFEQVGPGESPDVCIINTCAVTAESVRKSRQAVRKMKKLSPDAIVAVCGCHAKLDKKEVASIGADLIGGTDDREEFAKKVIELVREGATALGHPRKQTPPPVPRTRALLKIQDGCDNYCTYCIIPYARGKSRSMPLDEIVERAQKLHLQGYKEIVITGIEISSWRSSSDKSRVIVSLPCSASEPTRRLRMATRQPPSSLSEAIRTISTAAPGVRLRLGSLDPRVLTNEFIHELSKIPNLCNHFHISLQSGCDEVLQKMGRNYTTSEVLKAIAQLRSKFDNCAITADLIVGFPGETDLEFAQTLELIKKAAFSDMHIFPYSKRPGTKAGLMPNQIEKSIKQQRASVARQVAEQMKNEFLQSQIGKTVEVLIEEQKGKSSIGHASNYTKVTVISKIDKNTLKNVKIVSTKDGLLIGKIV